MIKLFQFYVGTYGIIELLFIGLKITSYVPIVIGKNTYLIVYSMYFIKK